MNTFTILAVIATLIVASITLIFVLSVGYGIGGEVGTSEELMQSFCTNFQEWKGEGSELDEYDYAYVMEDASVQVEVNCRYK